MKKISYAVIAIIVIVIIVVFARGDKKGTGADASVSQAKPIKIGAILPLTGPVASAGEAAKHGIEKAVSDLIKEGKKIEVVYEDGQYDSKASIAAYNKLKTNDGVNAIIVFGTPSTMPLVPLVNADHMPLMALTLAPVYSTPSDYTFRMIASGVATAKYGSDILIDKLGKKKIAVMYLTNDYGIGVLKSFKEFVGTRAKIVAEEGAATGVVDYRTQLTKIKASNPDGIYLAMAYKEAGLFVKQARELGITVPFVGDQPVDSPDFITTAGTASEGTIIISPTTASADSFTNEYTQTFGIAPSYLSVKMYDSVKVLGAVGEKCVDKNYSGECLKDNLYALKDFPGLSFAINYDANGDINDQLVTRVVKNGKLVQQEI
jgi:branched-chain amino acid transport system substrate-binding protein